MIGNKIIRLKEIESTNRYASELINSGATIEEGTVILADYQTAGRGTGENSWESERGKNLTLSIVLYPSFLAIEKQFMMNKIVSLAVFDMICKIAEGKEIVKIKWPNDIYAANKKIAGILIENAIIGEKFQYFISGIGININQEIFVSNAPNPVSLKNITGKDHDLNECLFTLCSCFENRYSQLKNNANQQLDNDYFSSLFRLDETASFYYKKQKITARIIGINEYGKLVLETTEGRIIDCDFKEVEFVL